MDTSLLLKYLECHVSPEEERAVREWLANDPDGSHAKKYKDAHFIFEGMTIHADKRLELSARRPSVLKRIARYAAAAAVAAFVIAGTAVLVRNNTLDMVAEKIETVYVPAGKTMELTLEDGTRMWLNSGTKIEYPSIFGRKSRNVKLLSGEVLFDVTRDEHRPFTVNTFASDIRVLGTKFDVLADEENGSFQTALIRGSVKVISKFDENDSIVLKPDQSVSMMNGRLVVASIEDSSSVICWRDGLVNLTDLPFEQLMRRFENVYNVKIVIERSDMPEIRYSRGKVRVSDGIDHALEMLSRASDFNWKHDRNSNSITILEFNL